MTQSEYNLTGVRGAQASIHNRLASSPIKGELARRNPTNGIAERIAAKASRARRSITVNSPITWKLSQAELPYRAFIVARLISKGFLIAEPKGLDLIEISGLFEPELID